MLKLFYKTILVSVLSCSLLMLDFSSKGIALNSSYAESVKTEKINDSDLMGTLTMTAVGTLASRLYKYKPTTDIMLAAAGGAIFIAGEVLAYVKLKDVMKGMEVQITRDKKGNINKEQIESLERLKKSYEEAKGTAETKKTLQMAAAAAFAAAGVMAFTMTGVEVAQLTACTSPIPAVIAAAAKSAAACSVSGCSAPFIACGKAATALSSALTAYELKKQAIGPSSGLYTALLAQNTALQAQSSAAAGLCSLSGGATFGMTCATKLTTDIINASTGIIDYGEFIGSSPYIKRLINDNIKTQKIAFIHSKLNVANESLFEKAFNLIFPKAEAGLFSMMGIASSAAVAFLLYTNKSLGPMIDMYMLIPKNRAIVWGVLAGLTFAATSATGNVISQIEANISKIDQILNSMYSMAQGAVATQTIDRQNTQTTPTPKKRLQFGETNYGEVDISGGENFSLPCYTGNDAKVCKPLSEQVKTTPGYNNLNSASQLQLSDIAKNADGFNGTSKISSSALKSASNLAGSANALRASLAKAQKNAQDALKKGGSKFDIDAQSKKLSGLLDKGVRDSLKKSNSNPAAMLSTMYGGKGAVGSSSPSTSAADTEKSKLEAGDLNGAGANVVDISAPGGEGADLGITGLEDGSKSEMSPEELAKFNEQQAALVGKGTIDEYDLKNDISNDSSSSIFDLISNRYQKSGYPRLFKIKEPQEPAPVTK